MGVRQCDKCSEMVDEAKAFCPGCGAAFVEEEQRQDVSRFEKLDNTVELGNTMYNEMLSDMGLNISKAAEKPAKHIEIIAPIETAPAAKTQAEAGRAKTSGPSSKTIWIVLAVLGLFILVPFAVVSLIILTRALMARF